MRAPDLEYLIEEEERKHDTATFQETYYYHLEMVRTAVTAPSLMNRKELLMMEKETRKQQEYRKLKRILGS